MSLATILIPARNAAPTIERAIRSALTQGNFPIVLIDDFSTDDTVTRAQAIAGRRLRVVCPPLDGMLGLVRQTGLEALETQYAIWLDADDELLPERVERMLEALASDHYDVATDGVELYDGPTGTFTSVVPIPPFLRMHHPLARLFERNYLPGPGVIGIRTDLALEIGYDRELHGPEDIDFLLRAVVAGARFCLMDTIGYRVHAYPGSTSRQLGQQRRTYRRCLLKHDYSLIRTLYRNAGHSDRVTTWGLVSVAIFREEYAQALEFLAEAEAFITDPLELLEPEGPCPVAEGWRYSFHRGTLLLLIGWVQAAIHALEAAERMRPSAEGANNLGVARAKFGDTVSARQFFEAALQRFPGFVDAQINLESPHPSRITTHPLRSQPARNDYPDIRTGALLTNERDSGHSERSCLPVSTAGNPGC